MLSVVPTREVYPLNADSSHTREAWNLESRRMEEANRGYQTGLRFPLYCIFLISFEIAKFHRMKQLISPSARIEG